MNWSLCPAVDRDPERCGGQWCFANTRMPVVFLFDNLNGGATVEEFCEWFPEITPEQVHEVLEFTRKSLELQPLTAA